MEESGRIRRGMFVAGVGAAQFAIPAAVDMLRGLRADPSPPETVYLATTDPANPFGTLLPWPHKADDSPEAAGHHAMARVSGAGVILVNGTLVAFLRRRNPSIRVFFPEDEPERSAFARQLAKKLAELAIRRQTARSGLLIGSINDAPARDHLLASFLEEAGFSDSASGYQMRGVTTIGASAPNHEDLSENDEEPDISEIA